MHESLSIRPGGLKPKNNLIEAMDLLCPGYPLPELQAASPVIWKGEGLHVSAVWAAPVSKMLVFANIYRYDKSFPIDYLLLFCFNDLQGYAPFSDLFTNSPAGFKSRKSIASLTDFYYSSTI
jgi:hypothetical protein